MLRTLTIRNLFLMESVDVCVQEGFTTITGETGAGKSTLLDTLRLVLGRKSDPNCVRAGAESGSVSAHFELSDDAFYTNIIKQLFHDSGMDWHGQDLVIRRTLKDGKSRVFCNDQPITMPLLKSIGDALCEWHGQYDDSLQPYRQQLVLDTWMLSYKPELENVFTQIAEYHSHIQRVQGLLEQQALSQKEANQKALYVEAVLRELDPLAPEENEETTILGELDELQTWNRIKDRLSDAVEQLPTVLKALYNITHSLVKAVGEDDPRMKTLERAALELEDVKASYMDDLAKQRHATEKLNTLEQRLGQLRHSALKWGVQPDELHAMWQEAKNFSPDSLDRSALTKELNEHTQAYNDLAEVLHQNRSEASEQLAARVIGELVELHLPHTRLEIRVEKSANTAKGWDDVTFYVSFNPGQPLGAMHKVASGGERARLMLVLRTLLGQERPLLVFDEVDQGVSGATAHAMGQRLRMVGEQQQIWAITHSAQVAGQANQHICVTKHVVDDSTRTQVNILKPDERIHEVARLLAGSHITDEALAAAQKLMS